MRIAAASGTFAFVLVSSAGGGCLSDFFGCVQIKSIFYWQLCVLLLDGTCYLFFGSAAVYVCA